MGKYSVLIKPSAVKELENIPGKKDRQRLVSKIQGLALNPRPSRCRKLSGRDLYRIRQGNYRVAYAIKDKELVITVITVGDRKNVYRAR